MTYFSIKDLIVEMYLLGLYEHSEIYNKSNIETYMNELNPFTDFNL